MTLSRHDLSIIEGDALVSDKRLKEAPEITGIQVIHRLSALARHNCHPKPLTVLDLASGTCSGEGVHRGMLPPTPEPFTPMPPLTASAPGQSQFWDLDRGRTKHLGLSALLFWVGEVMAALSLFIILFGCLILAEILK